MKILGVHHITIAVRDAGAAAATYASLFGAAARAASPRPVEPLQARLLDAALAGVTLQFAAPADNDSALTRFIERRGEGVYNIALEVEDLDAAVAELRARGVRVSDPIEIPVGMRSAFIAMAATHGVSVGLVEVVAGRSGAADQASHANEASADDQATGAAPAAAAPDRPPLRDLRPDEWEEWSDVD